jgi:O-antigen/teichoic acid export membrane protein
LAVFYLIGLRLEALIFATVGGYLGSVLVGHVLLNRSVQAHIPRVAAVFEWKTWLRFASVLSVNSMLRNVLDSTDVLFLGVFATAAQVGVYGAADRVSLLVVAPLLALNAAFSPAIAEFHARGQGGALANLFKLATKWSFTLSCPAFLSCVLFHDAILRIFGPQYVAASLVLAILAFGNLVDAGVGSVGSLLVMTGRPRVILANTVTAVALNICLAFWLVPRYHMIGAAIATSATVIMRNLTALAEVQWIIGANAPRP